MRSRIEPYEQPVRRAMRGRTILRILLAATFSVLGIVALASHSHRASAESSPPAPAAAEPLSAFATYRGHRIYYRHHRRYFMYHNHRHFLPRLAG